MRPKPLFPARAAAPAALLAGILTVPASAGLFLGREIPTHADNPPDRARSSLIPDRSTARDQRVCRASTVSTVSA